MQNPPLQGQAPGRPAVMRGMRTLARERPLLSYYLLALVIATGVMVAFFFLVAHDSSTAYVLSDFATWAAVTGRYPNIASLTTFAVTTERPATFLVFVFAAAPTAAALLVAVSAGGWRGVTAWLDRLRPWRNRVAADDGLRVYVAMAVVHLGVLGGYVAVARAYAASALYDKTWAALGGSLGGVVATVFVGWLIDEGGTFEEMGWRGFALPILQERLGSPLTASLCLGGLWMAWHLPREITNILGGVPLEGWLVGQAKFLLLCMALSVVATYLVNRTGGSAVPAILLHGGTNVWSKAAGGAVDAVFHVDVRTWIVVAAAALTLIAAGRSLGLRPGTRP